MRALLHAALKAACSVPDCKRKQILSVSCVLSVWRPPGPSHTMFGAAGVANLIWAWPGKFIKIKDDMRSHQIQCNILFLNISK